MTTNGKYRHPPPGFAVPPTAGFHSMHHILAENPPVYICLAVLNQDEFGLLPIDTLPGNKPREDKKKRKKFDRRGSTDGPGEMYLLKTHACIGSTTSSTDPTGRRFSLPSVT